MKLSELFEVFSPKSNAFGTDVDASNSAFEQVPPMMGMKVYYTFTDIGNYRYMIAFTDVGDKMFDLGFSAIPVEEQSNDFMDYLHLEPTNANQTIKVVNILGTIMQHFNDKIHANGFRFAGDSEKLDRLYARVAQSRQIQQFVNKNNFKYDGPQQIKVFGFGVKNYHIFSKK